jgi:mevalonate kinase
MSSSAQAPGKIILSGEHAVVYGNPALVMAVNRYAQVNLTPASNVVVQLGDLPDQSFAPQSLAGHKAELDARYQRYLDGTLSIAEVAPDPQILLAYTAACFFESADLPPVGFRLTINSDIPLGCGMGSSAAVILATLQALAHQSGCDWTKDQFLNLALQCENLQHGQSSGVDPYTCLHGGLIKFQSGKAETLNASPPTLHLVHTGKPDASTGECVKSVQDAFSDSAIWHQFEAVTEYIEDGLLRRDPVTLTTGFRQNHQLLQTIGVVPDPVADFVSGIERLGGAAKICGAGSVRGAKAGMLLVYGVEPPPELIEAAGYTLLPIGLDREGLR